MRERVLSASAVRWTLVLSVLCGVLAMHALVLGQSTHAPASYGLSDSATAGPVDHPPAGHSPAAHSLAGQSPAGQPPTDQSPAGQSPTDRSPAGHSPGGHDHGVLHLCLAALTVLAGLLAAPLLVQLLPADAGPRHDRGRDRAGRASTAPAAPPPPGAVRLARLCVLRT